MSLENNAQGRPSLKVTLPTLGAIASIAALFVFLGGFATGYVTFKSEMTSLKEKVNEQTTANAMTQERLNGLGERLAKIEENTKYISQGVAELRLAAVPRH